MIVDKRWLDSAELAAWVRLAAVLELLPAALDAQLRRDAQLTHFDYYVLAMLSEAPVRTQLWRSMFPAEVRLAADIDWERLGARWEMAGGYIKKAAVRAALIAATARPRRNVTHADLMEAALREYREMGRVMHGLA